MFTAEFLVGPRGSGRTSITRYLCRQLERGPHYVETAYLDCSSLKGFKQRGVKSICRLSTNQPRNIFLSLFCFFLPGKKIETLHREWQAIVQQLLEKQPSILVLDDLDLLASYPQNDHDDSLNGENWYSTRYLAINYRYI